MVRVEVRFAVRRPVGEVFAFLANFANDPLWRQDVVMAQQTSPGPLGEGATFYQVVKVFGKPMEAVFEVTEFRRDRRIAYRSPPLGDYQPAAEYTFEAMEDGTLVTMVFQPRVRGLLRLLGRWYARRLRWDVGAPLPLLAWRLETSPPGGGPGGLG